MKVRPSGKGKRPRRCLQPTMPDQGRCAGKPGGGKGVYGKSPGDQIPPLLDRLVGSSRIVLMYSSLTPGYLY